MYVPPSQTAPHSDREYDYCKFCQHHDCRYCRFNPANKNPFVATGGVTTAPAAPSGRVPAVGIDRETGRLACTDAFAPTGYNRYC